MSLILSNFESRDTHGDPGIIDVLATTPIDHADVEQRRFLADALEQAEIQVPPYPSVNEAVAD